MDKNILRNIRNFINEEAERGKNVSIHHYPDHDIEYFRNFDIKIQLNEFKDVVLQEETGLELGGTNKKSFLLIYPLKEEKLIEDGKITLIGKEMNTFQNLTVDFGIFILIGINEVPEKELENLSSFTFISNSIEGFSIRSIPRRFWCRISSDLLNKGFSFQFFGNAICYLYKKKFKDFINSIEVLFICSHSDSIEKFIKISAEFTLKLKEKWLKKIESWKKRIDCDYEWGCEICPYQVECYEIKKVLTAREKKE